MIPGGWRHIPSGKSPSGSTRYFYVEKEGSFQLRLHQKRELPKAAEGTTPKVLLEFQYVSTPLSKFKSLHFKLLFEFNMQMKIN